MPEFIETIKIFNGRVYNIDGHNQRCFTTRQHFYQNQKYINLRPTIVVPHNLRNGLIKGRITYTDQIHSIEYLPYTFRPICSLKLIDADHINYQFKYKNRTELIHLFDQRGAADDILMVKNGLITDTSYGNVALFNGIEWHTPRAPLLAGTQRSRLLRLRTIRSKNIAAGDLSIYTRISIFNAMIPFRALWLDINYLI